MRFGTIGTGNITRQWIAASALGNLELAAVYSRYQEKGEKFAGEYGDVRVYTDLEAFLSDTQIEVVYIASPNHLHFDQARRALLHGKHVIVEKPFVPTLNECKTLMALALEKGACFLKRSLMCFNPPCAPFRRICLSLASYA